MQTLVIFETIEGQTQKIADFVEHWHLKGGHGVVLYNIAKRSDPVSFDGIDRVVLAAPVHERRHPNDFEALVAANLDALHQLPTLMLSVSLKAAFPDGLEEAQDYLTEMEMRTGLTPTQEILVAGAVRSQSYGYFESQIVQHVVLAGHDVELVDGVREFTDWPALSTALSDFSARPAIRSAYSASQNT